MFPDNTVRRAFTLAELTASMGIMVILMGAMTSTILVASRAIPDVEDPKVKRLAAMDVVDQMAGELFYATSITEETETAVTFTVADRGHGAAGPETIRYGWSGTPGDPLTRQYNGGTVVTVCEDVQLFRLSYDKCAGQLDGPPAVLFLVADPWSITATETARRTAMEEWGFTVRLLPDYASAAEYDAERSNCDVVYVSCEVSEDVSAVIKTWSQGILCEQDSTREGLGVGNRAVWFVETGIDIVSNGHDITAPFPIGNLTIVDPQQTLMATRLGLAGGASLLGTAPLYGYDALVAIDCGGALYGGGMAAGRRVAMPWGDSGLNFEAVNADGLTIMRRAMTWAAAPAVYSGVQIILQASAEPEQIRTEVQVFNRPKVNPG